MGGARRSAGIGTAETRKMHCHEASRKRERHMSMPSSEGTSDVQDPVEGVGPAEAVEGSMAGQAGEDRAQAGKTAQRKLVRLVLLKKGRGRHSHRH